MTKKLNLFLIVLALFSTTSILGQTILTGSVRDKETNETLIGANVNVMNVNNRSLGGAMVDINGEFRITIPQENN